MNKFIFDKNIPAEIKPELEKYLLPMQWLVPLWCQRVHIQWTIDNKESNAATCSVAYEYRHAALMFYPCWHTCGEVEKRQIVVHELLHIYSSPMRDYADNLIETLLPEDEAPKHRKSALEEMRVRDESFVQDLSYSIVNSLAVVPK